MDCDIKIKYTFATGVAQELTLEVLLQEKGMTAEKAIALLEFLHNEDKAESLQQRRESRRHIPLDSFDDNVEAVKPVNPPPSVEDTLIRREMMDKLLTAIEETLTPKQKERLIKRIFEGLNEPEIALLEGVNQQAVSQSMIAAAKKIKKFLEGYL